jgi:fibroblast growth factor receptor 2
VTYDDAGWYTCVAANSLGSAAESAYLDVVAFFPADESVSKAPAKNNELYGWLVTFLMVFFVVALLIIMYVWQKYTKTKKLQRQMERVNQWTKKVIVVQPCVDNGTTGISETLVSSPQFSSNVQL